MAEFSIKLINCAFFARHGVFSEEEKLGQRFFVDAELKIMSSNSLDDDDIDDTVDYGAVYQCIEKIVTGKRRYLIEALAMDISKTLLKEFSQISDAAITVRKPNAPIQGVLDYVEVSVSQSR